jgi:Na+-transporting methylmalonyl-CoA/oxaloacetate decarboxylase beta subunit
VWCRSIDPPHPIPSSNYQRQTYPITALHLAAAQFGIFATLLGAIGLSAMGIFDFSLNDAAAIGIIGIANH